MNNFIFENKTKVYFGKDGVKEYLGCLLKNYGETVMLAYGGGSIKRNGVYDEIVGILNAAGKRIVEFSGIMSNPTYAKVQEGAKIARENNVDLILAVGGGSVSDCCKVVAAQAKLNDDIWEMEYTKHTYPTEFIPLCTIVTVFGTCGDHQRGEENQGRSLGGPGILRLPGPGVYHVCAYEAGDFRRFRHFKPRHGDLFREAR